MAQPAQPLPYPRHVLFLTSPSGSCCIPSTAGPSLTRIQAFLKLQEAQGNHTGSGPGLLRYLVGPSKVVYAFYMQLYLIVCVDIYMLYIYIMYTRTDIYIYTYIYIYTCRTMKCRIKHPKQRSPGIRLRWRPPDWPPFSGSNGSGMLQVGHEKCENHDMVTHMVKTVNTW